MIFTTQGTEIRVAMDDTPDTVTLRVARIVYLMTLGQRFTTIQVAELTGLTYTGALAMLDRMSASEYVPVTAEHIGPGRKQLWGLLVGEVHRATSTGG